MLQCVQVTDDPTAIVQQSIRPSTIVYVTTLQRTITYCFPIKSNICTIVQNFIYQMNSHVKKKLIITESIPSHLMFSDDSLVEMIHQSL
jgi:hypothetical protein